MSFAPPPAETLTIIVPAGATRVIAPGVVTATVREASCPSGRCSTNARRSTWLGANEPSTSVGRVDNGTMSCATKRSGVSRISRRRVSSSSAEHSGPTVMPLPP